MDSIQTLSAQMQVNRTSFRSREERSNFIRDTFQDYLSGTVLDIGCDRAVMRDVLGPERYCGVDIGPDADIQQNLETNPILPFEDRSWDTVMCIENLEHLDTLHQVWQELVRVTRKNLIVSFPNCWNHIRARLRRGHGSVWNYGLPAEPPEDRHKWFFSLLEALEFVQQRCDRDPMRIKELLVQESERPAVVRWLRRVRYPARTKYLNRYSNMLVCVLERQQDD